MASLDSSKRRGGDNVRTRKSEFQRGNTFNAPSLGSMHDVLHKKVINQVQIPKTEETTNLLIKALSSHFLFVSLHPKEVVELVEAMCVEVLFYHVYKPLDFTAHCVSYSLLMKCIFIVIGDPSRCLCSEARGEW